MIAQLALLGDPLPGSLVDRFKKRGNPNCKCAQPGARGHGSQWFLTTKVAGKTRSRVIPTHALEETRTHVAECQHLRRLVADLIALVTRSDKLVSMPRQSAGQG